MSQQRIVCAWCDTETAPGEEPTSHGICEECYNVELEKLNQTEE